MMEALEIMWDIMKSDIFRWMFGFTGIFITVVFVALREFERWAYRKTIDVRQYQRNEEVDCPTCHGRGLVYKEILR